MLQIQHLTKTYGDKTAVNDLSLHILPGEIYGFIGHNGAGKTTTLKSVAGILGLIPATSWSAASPSARTRSPANSVLLIFRTTRISTTL